MRSLRRFLPAAASWAAALGVGALDAYGRIYPGPGIRSVAAWMVIIGAAGYAAGCAVESRVRRWMRGGDG